MGMFQNKWVKIGTALVVTLFVSCCCLGAVLNFAKKDTAQTSVSAQPTEISVVATREPTSVPPTEIPVRDCKNELASWVDGMLVVGNFLQLGLEAGQLGNFESAQRYYISGYEKILKFLNKIYIIKLNPHAI